ncbi:MAG: M20/M25/M40 family metallo-hydrolase [Cyanobacteria bacterium HKST-UBA03]|nr:M20/M25/M40 family metallo-hydrolase [Cyanobacteria bacterium HKST-UBA03]
MRSATTPTDAAVNPDRLLGTFIDLLRLDSPSGQEGPVREYLLDWFARHQITAQADAHGNVIATLPARHSTAPPVVVTGHMDVVPPCSGVEPMVTGQNGDRVIRSNGQTVLGADDKSALAGLLEAIMASDEQQTARPEVKLLITVGEEVGLQGAYAMDPSHYADCVFGVAFDHTGEQGLIVHEAPTLVEFALTVTGKSVHAGICPEHGVNAITHLLAVVNDVPTGRVDLDGMSGTFNWGWVEGGKGTNVVPDQAVARGEFRSLEPQMIDRFKARLEAAIARHVVAPASATLTFDTQFEHYRTDPEHPYVQAVADTFLALGCTPNIRASHGGSDLNVFANRGLPGVVLSAGYHDPHALSEHVYLKDMVTMVAVLLGFWQAWAGLTELTGLAGASR